MVNFTPEAFKHLLQSNCSQSCHLSKEQKEKTRFWCHSNCIAISEKNSRNVSNQSIRLYQQVICCYVSIPKQIIRFLVLLTSPRRIISTADFSLQHLLARRLCSERVCTFKSTRFPLEFTMNLFKLFPVSQNVSTERGQESRTCYKSPISDMKE